MWFSWTSGHSISGMQSKLGCDGSVPAVAALGVVGVTSGVLKCAGYLDPFKNNSNVNLQVQHTPEWKHYCFAVRAIFLFI